MLNVNTTTVQDLMRMPHQEACSLVSTLPEATQVDICEKVKNILCASITEALLSGQHSTLKVKEILANALKDEEDGASVVASYEYGIFKMLLAIARDEGNENSENAMLMMIDFAPDNYREEAFKLCEEFLLGLGVTPKYLDDGAKVYAAEEVAEALGVDAEEMIQKLEDLRQ